MGGDSASFDLVEEAWIPVRLDNGVACELGLRDVLVRSHEIGGLDIEFPTQEPALLRLLIAICYRALQGPADDDAWEELWTAGRLPEARITDYLRTRRDRFDLFHPDTPFFQSPQLEATGKDGTKPASKLIAHAPSGNNVPIFTPITEAGNLVLRPAEAARWVVERHAWGTTADKTGAKGNSRVKAGKDTPQVGHLGWIGFVAPVGASLFETLLFNLVPQRRETLITTGPSDRPAWERDPTGPTRRERAPEGTCDLFTWQGRRIRLFPETLDGEMVVARVLICAGDDVLRDAVRTIDPHTGWRVHKEPKGTLTYSPTRARMGQQVWRGLSALLALDEDTQRAGVLSWLAVLDDLGMASRASLLITAAQYGSMSTTMEDLVSDRLDTALAVLREEQPAAATLASGAASFTEQLARALWNVANGPFLSYDHEHDRYGVPEGKADQARAARDAITEEFYGELDAPFRRFLVDLGTADFVTEQARGAWSSEATRIALDLARRALGRLRASDAFTGALAEGWFRRALSKAQQSFSPRTTEAAR